jgi:hypothetical protein
VHLAGTEPRFAAGFGETITEESMKPSIDYGREDIVKFLYLEPLLMGQRALVIGPENEVVRQIFQRMGCAAVKLYQPAGGSMPDWDMAALRGKRDKLDESRRLLPFGAGAYDIIFIPELAAVPDVRLVLSECARILGDSGLLILSARNAECTVAISQSGMEETPDIWSMRSLVELTRTYFRVVDNVGQCPFLAYACVSYDADRVQEGVRLDTSLMEERSEEPEFYLVLCSQQPLSTKLSNAIYQVPVSEMTLAEAPETAADPAEGPSAASLGTENELLKKEVAERNVLASRLKKEIERLEAEAEERRQKMFDMKQKMEQERKSVQKEVLEKAIQKQVDKIPETWLGEREAMVREMEQLKKDNKFLTSENRKLDTELGNLKREAKAPRRAPEAAPREIEVLRTENRKLQDENRRLREGAKPAAPAGAELDSLRKKLAAKERLVADLLLEMEMMPQVGFGDDVPSGEGDVLEAIGKMEEMKRSIAEGGETAAMLSAKIQELQLSLQEEKLRSSAGAKENLELSEKIKELVATVDMLVDLDARAAGSEGAAQPQQAARLHAVLQYCLGELKRLSEARMSEAVGRELALLWAKVDERRRLALGGGGETRSM